MCGIVGYVEGMQLQRDKGRLREIITRMNTTLSHRGPDDDGVVIDNRARVALGHRRLSILDVSSAAHQPMTRHGMTIAFNGEVYNFRVLRRELEQHGYQFWGSGDTEVVLAAIHHWGTAEASRRFIGMFAIAVWHERDRRLELVRDRVGIKPLYYAQIGGKFYFASELRAIEAVSAELTINRNAVAGMLRHSYIMSPATIYNEVRKLPPGSIGELKVNRNSVLKIESYWCLPSPGLYSGSREEFLDELDSTIASAVQLRMIADVPLGAFLSGGVDSSLIVSYMQRHTSRQVETFSIGFDDGRFDESAVAEAVAGKLGTRHHSLKMTEADAIRLAPEVVRVFDEPFADSSQLPMWLVSRFARRHVTVALSGDGGDELFAGYTTYVHARRMWKRLGKVPRGLRRLLGRRALHAVAAFSSSYADRAAKLQRIVGSCNEYELYWNLVASYEGCEELVVGSTESCGREKFECSRGLGGVRWMQSTDFQTYLPDDILTKVDRTSMNVGLEARVPLLDHNVVELSMKCPESLAFAGGVGKVALKELLCRTVPQNLIERPKKGFSVPLADWLRGPLRDWIEEAISENRIRSHGILDSGRVRGLWHEHLQGKVDRSKVIWNIAVMQHWLAARQRTF